MKDIEAIIREVNGTMAIEEMPITAEDKERIYICLRDSKKIDSAVASLLEKYTTKIDFQDDMGFETIVFEYNCFLSASFFTEINVLNGLVFYKAMVSDKIVNDSDCFFIVPAKRINSFSAEFRTLKIDEWFNSDCSYDRGILIDGYNWYLTLKIGDQVVKKQFGRNARPSNFNLFVLSVEKLINKEFGYNIPPSFMR